MLVGVIGEDGLDRFAGNVAAGLERMGQRVVRLGPSRRPSSSGRLLPALTHMTLHAWSRADDRMQERLLRTAAEHGVEQIITTDARLSPTIVAEFRRRRVPVALWYPDHVANLGDQRMLAAPYTAMFFKDPLLVRRLRDLPGLPAWYLPEACDPRLHRPLGPAGDRPVVAVVGNTYPSRILLLRRLREAGIPLAVYGSAPPRRTGDLLPRELRPAPPIFGEEKARVFRGAVAVLNNLHPAEMEGVNCRLFEATGSGAAVLCEWRPVLPDLYDPEREVVPFRTFDELVERARELLAEPRLTAEIGDAATKRAHAEHTYENRLPIILERLS